MIALLTIMLPDAATAMPTSAALKPSKETEELYKISNGMTSRQLYEKGRQYLDQTKPDSAIIYYSILLERLNDASSKRSEDIDMLPQVYNNIGYTYLYHYNDYVQAYTNLLHALKSTEEASDHSVLPYIYLNIANVYASFNDQSTAIDYYRKAFESQYSMDPASQILPVIALNLFPAAYMEKRSTEIEEDIKRYLKLERDGTPTRDAAVEVAKGLRLHIEGDRHGAAERFGKALAILKGSPDTDPRIIHSVQLFHSEALSQIKEYEEAADILKHTLTDTERDGTLDLATVAAHNLSHLYRSLNRRDSADHYRLRHIDLKDSLMNAANYARIRDLQSIYEISSANEEIRILSDKDRMKTFILYVCLVGGTVLLTLLITIIRKNRMLRSRNEKLYEQSQQLLRTESKVTEQLPDATEESRETPKEEVSDCVPDVKESPNERPEPRESVMDAKAIALKDEIQRIMESDAICAPDFSLESLARLLDEKSRTVSGVINAAFGTGFNQLLSESRIKKACRMLSHPDFDHLTVQSIGESLGFKSRSNFGSLFKKQTGLSPGEYHSISLKKRTQT